MQQVKIDGIWRPLIEIGKDEHLAEVQIDFAPEKGKLAQIIWIPKKWVEGFKTE